MFEIAEKTQIRQFEGTTIRSVPAKQNKHDNNECSHKPYNINPMTV